MLYNQCTIVQHLLFWIFSGEHNPFPTSERTQLYGASKNAVIWRLRWWSFRTRYQILKQLFGLRHFYVMVAVVTFVEILGRQLKRWTCDVGRRGNHWTRQNVGTKLWRQLWGRWILGETFKTITVKQRQCFNWLVHRLSTWDNANNSAQ